MASLNCKLLDYLSFWKYLVSTHNSYTYFKHIITQFWKYIVSTHNSYTHLKHSLSHNFHKKIKMHISTCKHMKLIRAIQIIHFMLHVLTLINVKSKTKAITSYELSTTLKRRSNLTKRPEISNTCRIYSSRYE